MLYLLLFSIRLDIFSKITINYILFIKILINVYCGNSYVEKSQVKTI